MVALMVLAIALAALIHAASTTTANTTYLRDKTIAHWVALNRMVENQLAQPWPSVGTSTGTEEMAGWEWSWHVQIEKTEDDYVRRMIVEVRREENDNVPLVSLVGYLRRSEAK